MSVKKIPPLSVMRLFCLVLFGTFLMASPSNAINKNVTERVSLMSSIGKVWITLRDSHLKIMLERAQLQFSAGDFRASFSTSLRMTDIAKKSLGEEHPLTLEGMAQLAISYGALGDFATATQMMENLLPKIQLAFGEKSMNMIALKINLAMYYENMGKYHEGREILQDYIQLCRDWLGEESPWTLRGLSLLIGIDLTLGLDAEAQQLIDNVFQVANQKLPNDDRFKFDILSDLAKSYYRFGKYQKAIEILEEVAEKYAELLGEYHHESLAASIHLAAFIRTMDPIAALHHDLQLVRKCKENLEEAHPMTLHG